MGATPANTRSNRAVIVTALVAASVVAVTGWATHSAFQVMSLSEGWVTHTYEVEATLQDVSAALHDAESAERSFLIVGQESLLQPYGASRARIAPGLQRVEILTRDNAAQQARVAGLQSQVNALIASFDRVIGMRRAGVSFPELAEFSGEAERQAAGVFQRVAEMETVERELLSVRAANVHRARIVVTIAQTSLVILSLAQIAVLLFVARLATTRIRRDEERLAVIFASIGDGVIATDRDGLVERMNPVAESLTGWDAVDAAGQPIDAVFKIVHETTRAPAVNPVHQVLREFRVVQLANHTVLIAKDGTECPIEDCAAPIRGQSPRGDGVVLVFRDATTQRELERSRADSEARFRRIADDMPQIVYVLDEDGATEYLNRRWIEYTGRAAMRPPLAEESIHPDDRAELADRWLRARQSGAVLEGQVRIRDRNGRYRWFLSRAVPMRDTHGNMRWYGTCTDIDEQVQASAVMAEAHRRKDEFLVSLSHELRDPLAPIRNAVHLLRAPAVEADQKRWAADVIERQVQNMALLLDDLLDMSRITRGTIVLRKEATLLRSVVDGAVELARPLIESRNHVLTVAGELDTTVELDQLRITQTIGNLLTNAAKYSDTGARIDLIAGADDRVAWISVRDTGIGLAAEEVSTVFDLFSQVKSAQERSMGGLGVGLALVKGFVELHGGYVTAASEGQGLGSEFRVVLPRIAGINLDRPAPGSSTDQPPGLA